MKDGEYRVWNLLDPQDREAASKHVQEQMDTSERDMHLLARADQALAEIAGLLLTMRELAQEATQPGADREALDSKFSACQDRIDQIFHHSAVVFSAEEKARMEDLLTYLDGGGGSERG